MFWGEEKTLNSLKETQRKRLDVHLEESWHWLRPFLHLRYRPVVVVVGIFVVGGAVLSTIVVVVAVVFVVMLEAVVVSWLAVAVVFVVAVFVVVVVVVVVVAAAVVVQDVAGRAVATLESAAEAGRSHHAVKPNTSQIRTLSSVPRLERLLCGLVPRPLPPPRAPQ